MMGGLVREEAEKQNKGSGEETDEKKLRLSSRARSAEKDLQRLRA